MDKNDSIKPFQKVVLSFSLILLGIAANTTFFSLIVTFLLGTVTLGLLNSQEERFALKKRDVSKDRKLEKIPAASSVNSK
ncbi:hypothetical protein [Crocosphaera sp. Alani8]|uniref:hypothetical protein n=1 Tax=Crocosphaera sp. Alani8 TaxID=3038952 RepID=UPI00313CC216